MLFRSRKTAVTKVFGNDFRRTHELMKDHMAKVYPDKFEIGSYSEFKMNQALNYYTGVGNIPQEGAGATLYKGLNTTNKLIATQVLNWTGFTSMNDIANMMVHATTQQGMKMDNFTGPIRNLIASVAVGDRKVIADLTKTSIDLQFRELVDLGGPQKSPGYLSKALSVQMTLNGTKAVTGVMREAYSRHIMQIFDGLVTKHRGSNIYKQTMGAIGQMSLILIS